MFDFFNNRLFDLNRDGKVDIFEKAFVYHTLFEDDDKNVSRNDDYDDDDCDECDCDDCDDLINCKCYIFVTEILMLYILT